MFARFGITCGHLIRIVIARTRRRVVPARVRRHALGNHLLEARHVGRIFGRAEQACGPMPGGAGHLRCGGGSICLPAEGAGRPPGYEQGVNDTLCLVRDGHIPCETKEKVGP